MRTDDGYVRVYRRVWDNPVFRNRQEAAVFVWMVSVAQWREATISTRFGPVRLFPDELIFAEREVAAQFSLPRTTLQRLVARMVVSGMICADHGRMSGRNGAIVAILNYKEYQGLSGNSTEGLGQSRAEPGPDQGQSWAQNKEENTGKKEEEIPCPTDTVPAGAELFPSSVVKLPDLCAAAVAAGNEMAAGCGLSGVRTLTAARRAALRKRLAECGGLDGWRAVLAEIPRAPFLLGDGPRGWKIDFDALIQPKTFTKLREGAYANRGRPQAKVGAGWMLDPAAYLADRPGAASGAPVVDLPAQAV
jgi:hypothetical protein